LRLAFGTPRAWLADGKEIKVSRAPTVFGPVSYTIQSHLAQGTMDVDLDLPLRVQPQKTLLRLRLPDGAKVADAPDGQTLDITGKTGHVTMQIKVGK
jgi:hypothetical protein